MTFECPNCSQHLDVEGDNAGRTIHCPTCGQAVIIPDPFAPDASPAPVGARPPIHVPLQPLAAGSTKQLIKKRKGCGCANLLLFLIILALGGFSYAMYRFQKPPSETWERLTTMA